LLRFMMQDDPQTFWDLVWSVGGSPPYGGVSFEEAEAVYHLIEDFRGSGMAPPARYEAVREVIKGHPERELALDLFHCYDEIVSASETYAREIADKGLAIAESISQPAAVGLFKLFQAGVSTREGKYRDAAALTLEALEVLRSAAENDPACNHRVEQAAQNAVTLTALAGDKAKATQVLDDLAEVLGAHATLQLRHWIARQA